MEYDAGHSGPGWIRPNGGQSGVGQLARAVGFAAAVFASQTTCVFDGLTGSSPDIDGLRSSFEIGCLDPVTECQNVGIGSHVTLTVSIPALIDSGPPQKIIWVSEDSALAAVDSLGVVTGLDVGQATIVARLIAPELDEVIADTLDVTVFPRLMFDTQPNNVEIGAALDTILVSIRDGQDRPIVSNDPVYEVTLRVGFPDGALLVGPTTVETRDGIAVFDDIKPTPPGIGYRLTAESGPLTSATSETFEIFLTPDSLVFSRTPQSAVAGEILDTIVVQAVGILGNLIKGFEDSISIFITNPSGNSLEGDSKQPTVGGEATFDNLVIRRAGSSYRLTASVRNLLAISEPFTINAGPPIQLHFFVEPNDVVAGSVLNPIQVEAEDREGNRTEIFVGSVQLEIAEGPVGGAILGTPIDIAEAGVAVFSGLSFEKSGDYRLEARATDLTSQTSRRFTVAPDSASSFAIDSIRPAVTVGSAFDLFLTSWDQFGNIDTNFNESDFEFVVSIVTGPGGAALDTSNMNVVSPAGGRVRVKNLKLDTVGDYELMIDANLTDGIGEILKTISGTTARFMVNS